MIYAVKGKTPRLLAQALGQTLITNSRELPEMNDFVVNWGKTSHYNAIRGLNRSEAVRLASDKRGCRDLLYNAGISVPKPSETDFPVLGRTTKHSKGRGFFVCHNQQEIEEAKDNGATYFSKFYTKDKEYRVHIAGNRVILFSEKLGNAEAEAWNYESGFKFKHLYRHVWLENPQLMRIQKECKKAMQIIGLDFGAIDVFTTQEGNFYISEINTAPSLSPLALSKYVKYFQGKE